MSELESVAEVIEKPPSAWRDFQETRPKQKVRRHKDGEDPRDMPSADEPWWDEDASPEKCFALMVAQVQAWLSSPRTPVERRLKLFRIVASWKIQGEEANKQLTDLKELLHEVRGRGSEQVA